MSWSPGDEHPDPVYDTGDGFVPDCAVIRDATRLERDTKINDLVIRDNYGTCWLASTAASGALMAQQFGDETAYPLHSMIFPVTVIERI